MSEFQEIMQRVETLHSTIADAICPDGQAGHMACRVGCGAQFPIQPADVARYLRHGWPRCCGREMRWVQEANDD